MAEDTDNTYDGREEPFDLGPVVAPLTTSGMDPRQVRANPQLFAKLAGGGIGTAPTDSTGASTPSNPPAMSESKLAVTPSSVTPSGRSQIAESALERANAALASAPDFNAELAKEDQSEAQLRADTTKRAQDLRGPDGKLLPQYAPKPWQRVLRGLQGAAEGFGGGGIRGAIVGAVNPATVRGGHGYGDPNKAGEQELRTEDAAVTGDQQSLSELRNRFKESQEAAYGRAREETALANLAKDTADKGPKPERVVDSKGHVKYVSPDEANSGEYFDPTTYNAENKTTQPTNYEQTVIAAQNEQDPKGPFHRAAQEMRDTEVKKFKAANNGRQPTDLELWNQAFHSEYGRAPNSEEIASRKVAGGGLAGEATGRGGKAQDRTAFDSKWSAQFDTMEKKYDARKKAIVANEDLSGDEQQAQLAANEADRNSEKQGIQNEKDKAAEQSGVYSQAAPPPRAAAPAQPNQPNQNQNKNVPTKSDVSKATKVVRNPKTNEKAYLINGQWYRDSQLK